jgi:hypothetical protein
MAIPPDRILMGDIIEGMKGRVFGPMEIYSLFFHQ